MSGGGRYTEFVLPPYENLETFLGKKEKTSCLLYVGGASWKKKKKAVGRSLPALVVKM